MQLIKLTVKVAKKSHLHKKDFVILAKNISNLSRPKAASNRSLE